MDSGSLYKIAHSELDDGAEPHASLFVSLSRNRTGALSPNNRNGALRQFVSKALIIYPQHLASCQVHKVDEPTGGGKPSPHTSRSRLTSLANQPCMFRPVVGQR
jgi:hypothetical protein